MPATSHGAEIDKTIDKTITPPKAASASASRRMETRQQAALREARSLQAQDEHEDEFEDDPFAPPKPAYAHAVLGSHPSLAETGMPMSPVPFLDKTIDARGRVKVSQAAGVAPRGAPIQTVARTKKRQGQVDDPFGMPSLGLSPRSSAGRGPSASGPDPFMTSAASERQPLLGKSSSRRVGGTATGMAAGGAAAALGAAGGARDRFNAVSKAMQEKPGLFKDMITVSLLPWFFFNVSSLFLLVMVDRSPDIAFLVPAVIGMFCLLSAVYAKGLGLAQKTYSEFLCAVATFAGIVAGGYVYARWFREHRMFVDHRQYSNVWPTEMAAAHRDASAIVFAEGTRVDVRLTSNFGTGLHIYCVAPVTMRSSEAMPDVQYWAAGIDCCSDESFECGDSGRQRARAGVVIRNETVPLYAAIQGMNYNYYMEAARRSMQRYGIVSTAEQPMFLHWALDIEEGPRRSWWMGFFHWLLFSFLYLIVCFVLVSGSPAMAVHLNRPPPTLDEKEAVVQEKT